MSIILNNMKQCRQITCEGSYRAPVFLMRDCENVVLPLDIWKDSLAGGSSVSLVNFSYQLTGEYYVNRLLEIIRFQFVPRQQTNIYI